MTLENGKLMQKFKIDGSILDGKNEEIITLKAKCHDLMVECNSFQSYKGNFAQLQKKYNELKKERDESDKMIGNLLSEKV